MGPPKKEEVHSVLDVGDGTTAGRSRALPSHEEGAWSSSFARTMTTPELLQHRPSQAVLSRKASVYTDPNAASAASFSANRMLTAPAGESNPFYSLSRQLRPHTITRRVQTSPGLREGTEEQSSNFADFDSNFGADDALLQTDATPTFQPGIPTSKPHRRATRNASTNTSDEGLPVDHRSQDELSTDTDYFGQSHSTRNNFLRSPEVDLELDFEGIANLLSGRMPVPTTSGDKTYSSDEKRRCLFYSGATGIVEGTSLGSLTFHENSQPTIDQLRSEPFWIDISEPTFSEMVLLGQLFGIHPLTTEDIQTEETREKCEMFMHYYFISIRTFDQDEYTATYMQPISLYIVVFRECILSFHSKPLPHPKNVLQRIEQLRAYGLNVTPDWVNYALIDDITDSFMPVLRFIELEVDSIDDLVLILKESEQTDMLRRIGSARKKVLQLLRLLTSKSEVLRTVIKRSGERLSADNETSLYLGDIQDHVISMVQNLFHFEKTLARSHSNYLAQISIEITQASNRMNDVVLRMTALGSILLPMNLVTGLFGMNVWVPGQSFEDNLSWFFGIVGALAVFAAVVWLWARKNRLM